MRNKHTMETRIGVQLVLRLDSGILVSQIINASDNHYPDSATSKLRDRLILELIPTVTSGFSL